MSFKSESAFAVIDELAGHLRRADETFTLYDTDHVWPKIGNREQRCRCPKHGAATDSLFFVCYKRIMEAKNGVPLRSAAQWAKDLEGLR